MTPTSSIDSILEFLPNLILDIFLVLIKFTFRFTLYLSNFLKNVSCVFNNQKSTLTNSLRTNQSTILYMNSAENIAFNAESANQYYETTVDFFIPILGPYLKYSACFFEDSDSLAQAEINTLKLYCDKVELKDGMRILDAGCGWGSLSFYICKNYPNCEVVAITLSTEASNYMTQQACRLGLSNLTIECCDLTKKEFTEQERFDRIFYVEVVEFMRDIPGLFQLTSSWLKETTANQSPGKVLVHSFCSSLHYPTFLHPNQQSLFNFIPSWFSFYMLSGAIIPGIDTLLYFQDHLKITSYEYLPGTHYSHTIDHWRKNLSSPCSTVTKSWWFWWHVFALVTAELFRFRGGQNMGIALAVYENR